MISLDGNYASLAFPLDLSIRVRSLDEATWSRGLPILVWPVVSPSSGDRGHFDLVLHHDHSVRFHRLAHARWTSAGLIAGCCTLGESRTLSRISRACDNRVVIPDLGCMLLPMSVCHANHLTNRWSPPLPGEKLDFDD